MSPTVRYPESKWGTAGFTPGQPLERLGTDTQSAWASRFVFLPKNNEYRSPCPDWKNFSIRPREDVLLMGEDSWILGIGGR